MVLLVNEAMRLTLLDPAVILTRAKDAVLVFSTRDIVRTRPRLGWKLAQR
jgi:hypothetical protein